MANHMALVRQTDVTKILKAFQNLGLEVPVLVFEPQRITAKPANAVEEAGAQDWIKYQ